MSKISTYAAELMEQGEVIELPTLPDKDNAYIEWSEDRRDEDLKALDKDMESDPSPF